MHGFSWFLIGNAFLLGTTYSQRSERKPNIVYILADDLGYGDLSCYGQDKFSTPNIDRMAANGMKFTQHYSGSTVCAPARCSLMTGLHTGRAQIRGNEEIRPEGQAPLAPGTMTIPLYLRKAGYTNGMFGKWGLGYPGSSGDPMNHFDRFYGYNCQRHAHNYYPEYLWSDDETVETGGDKYAHDLIIDEAKKFITENRDKSFFCYLPVLIPHAAMQAPRDLHDKYRELYPEFDDRVSRYGGAEVVNPVAAFPAMVEHLDRGVGEIIQLIRDLNLDERTLVIFTSDNGPHRAGGQEPGFWNSSGPLRGIKRDLYEGGIRVPFIATWPGMIKAGSTSDHISAFWDMLPTFCEIAGVDIPDGIDGISMLPELLGKEQRKHEYLYWEYNIRGGSQAIRMGDYKALRRNLRSDDPVFELYNLAEDISESENIAHKHPEISAKMKRLFATARKPSELFPLFGK